MKGGPWLLLFFFTIIWYVIVTIAVAIRGAGNIRSIIKQDEDQHGPT